MRTLPVLVAASVAVGPLSASPLPAEAAAPPIVRVLDGRLPSLRLLLAPGWEVRRWDVGPGGQRVIEVGDRYRPSPPLYTLLPDTKDRHRFRVWPSFQYLGAVPSPEALDPVTVVWTSRDGLLRATFAEDDRRPFLPGVGPRVTGWTFGRTDVLRLPALDDGDVPFADGIAESATGRHLAVPVRNADGKSELRLFDRRGFGLRLRRSWVYAGYEHARPLTFDGDGLLLYFEVAEPSRGTRQAGRYESHRLFVASVGYGWVRPLAASAARRSIPGPGDEGLVAVETPAKSSALRGAHEVEWLSLPGLLFPEETRLDPNRPDWGRSFLAADPVESTLATVRLRRAGLDEAALRAYLARFWKPVASIARVDRWLALAAIDDLGHGDFARREQASRRLARCLAEWDPKAVHALLVPALERALLGPSAERRARIARLLPRLPITPVELERRIEPFRPVSSP
jgi:hypothetical protein